MPADRRTATLARSRSTSRQRLAAAHAGHRQVTGPALDSIIISPRSHDQLHLPGEHSTDSRPPGNRVKVTSTDPDYTSAYTEERQLGSPERYLVGYDVWNHRDRPHLR
jgi:hypothetical protein